MRGRLLQSTKKRILERDEYECRQCGKLVEYHESHMDHVIPLVAGGGHNDSNLQTLCHACSKSKTKGEQQ